MSRTPNFLAEHSIYDSSRHYRRVRRERTTAAVTSAFVNPDCFANCYNNCSGDCLGLVGSGRGACLQECRRVAADCTVACTVAGCVPSTTCYQDTTTTDPKCLVCYRDNCDGTNSVWYTC